MAALLSACGAGAADVMVGGGTSGADSSSEAGQPLTSDSGGNGFDFGMATGEPTDLPPALDCSAATNSVAPRRWLSSYPDDARTEAFAANPFGGVDVLVGERIVRFDASGEVLWEIDLEFDRHPTVLAVDADGSMLVGGAKDAGLSGEINGFLSRYDMENALRAEVEIDTEPFANEVPSAIAVSATGYVALTMEVEFDDLMPNATDFTRLDRFGADLSLLNAMELDPPPDDIAIDEQGFAIAALNAAAQASVVAIDLDGTVLWQRDLDRLGGRLSVAVGEVKVWVAQPESTGVGGGRVTAITRSDPFSIATIFLPDGNFDALTETPVDVAALPCGGALLITDAHQGGTKFVTLSTISDDNVRGESTDLDPIPPAPGTSYRRIYGVSVAANGRATAAGEMSAQAFYLWLLAF